MGHKLNLAMLAAVSPEQVVIEASHEIVKEAYILLYRGGGDNSGKLRNLKEAMAACAAIDSFGWWRESVDLSSVGDTRWVSHERAANTLVKVLKGVLVAVKALADSGNEKAVALLAKCSSFCNLLGVFLMAELGPVLAGFSAALQSKSLSFHESRSIENHYVSKLKPIKEKPEETKLYWNCAPLLNDALSAVKDHEPITVEHVRTFHNEHAAPYILKLLGFLEEKMKGTPVLEAFSVYDVRSPSFTNSEMARQQVDVITNFYGKPGMFTRTDASGNAVQVTCPPFLNNAAVEGLKSELDDVLQKLKIVSEEIRSTCYGDVVLRFLSLPNVNADFPYTKKMLELSLVFPLSNAGVERLFSSMKLVRTVIRANMMDDTMERLLKISLSLTEYCPVNGLHRDFLRSCVEAFISGERRLSYASFDEYMAVVQAVRHHRKTVVRIRRLPQPLV